MFTSMYCMYCLRYLLRPLKQYESIKEPCALLILLDGLDEAEHDREGCLPVLHLISER
jgi:hypothetical protein